MAHALTCSHIVGRRLGQSMVLVNLGTNDILELNETGSRIWELAQETPVHEIGDRLALEFEIDPREADRAVVAFLSQLESQGILQLKS
jgi:hypothetical protein